MIQTNIQQLSRYEACIPEFAAVLETIQQRAMVPFQPGKTEIHGERLFVNAVSYETKEPDRAVLEAHRKYIDVMYVHSGQETIACTALQRCQTLLQPYEEAGDALLAALEPNCTLLTMYPGDIVVLFPEDAHAPGLHLEGSHTVEKMIFKVQVK